MSNDFPSTVSIRARIVALKDPNALIRQEAIHYLARSVVHDDEVIPAVADALDDVDVDVSREAAVALFMFGSRARIVVPTLVRALAHADVIIRRAAAATVGSIGPDAAAAVGNLRQLENDPDELLRVWVRDSLRAIGNPPDTLTKKSQRVAG